jgi:hypothetical protein
MLGFFYSKIDDEIESFTMRITMKMMYMVLWK